MQKGFQTLTRYASMGGRIVRPYGTTNGARQMNPVLPYSDGDYPMEMEDNLNAQNSFNFVRDSMDNAYSRTGGNPRVRDIDPTFPAAMIHAIGITSPTLMGLREDGGAIQEIYDEPVTPEILRLIVQIENRAIGERVREIYNDFGTANIGDIIAILGTPARQFLMNYFVTRHHEDRRSMAKERD